MRKRALRFVASLLCATLLVYSDGVAVMASDVSNGEIIVTEPSVTVSENEIIEDPVAEEDQVIEEVTSSEEVTFTDSLGYSFVYNAGTPEEYQYDVSAGELLSVKDKNGETLSGNVVLSANKGITSIAASAFSGNKAITYVAVPYGVTTIGTGAFADCTALQSVSLPKSVSEIKDEAFLRCSSLVQIAIPKKVSSIGKYAFSKAEKLYIVYMSDIDYSKLTAIDDYAFEGCKSLKYFCSDSKVDFPLSLSYIGNHAFEGCLTISSLPLSNNITYIGEYAFAKCDSLTKITIPDGLTVLKKGSFAECGSVDTLEIGKGKALQTIEEEAFKNCYSLGRIELSNKVTLIEDAAFKGCTNLASVRFLQSNVSFIGTPFESPDNHVLYLIGSYSDSIERYCLNKANIVYLEKEDDISTQTYKCIIPDEITGGKLEVFLADGTTDVKTTGVTEGTVVYVTVTPKDGYELVPSSLRYNGNVLTLTENKYSFEMPLGGALVTAEFRLKSKEKKIAGTDFDITFSNGTIDERNSNVIKLKLGEKSAIILIDTYDGSVIPSEKITYDYVSSQDAQIVTVNTSGGLTPLKTGDGKLKVSVTGKDGKIITKTLVVSVSSSTIADLWLKASKYNSDVFTITKGENETETASANTINLKKNYEITLKATAYDAEERNISVKLDWKTTDKNVAYPKKDSTTNMQNTIVIPKNASGEATITVTAKIDNSTTITKKFLVVARDYSPRISSKTVSVNPKKTTQSVIKLYESYGAQILNPEKITFSDNSDLSINYLGKENGCYSFEVSALTDNVKDGSYKDSFEVKVENVDVPIKYEITATVKRSVPSPKLSFRKNTAVELFNKIDSKGIVLDVSNLGDNIITNVNLKSLSSDKEKNFENNFKIEKDGDKYYVYKKADVLAKDSKGRAVVKGLVEITFAGYKDTVTKEITVPVKTTKNTLKLSSTSKTFNTMATGQLVEISVLDKAGKAVDLSDSSLGNFHIEAKAGSVVTNSDIAIANGKIYIGFSSISAGKINLRLTNDDWASNQYYDFTYTVKTSTKNPKSSLNLSKGQLKLNALYPNAEGTFKFTSDQYDTDFACEQSFTAKPGKGQASEITKIAVSYDSTLAEGKVKITDNSIKAGTYKFETTVQRRLSSGAVVSSNKITLSVVVSKTNPTTSLKSTSISVNQKSGTDKARMVLTSGNVPEGYTLDEAATRATLACTTKNNAGLANYVGIEFAKENNAKNVEEQVLYVKMLGEWLTGSYKLSITPMYRSGETLIAGKTAAFTLKIYGTDISLSLKATGSLNLANRIDPLVAVASYNSTEKKMLFTNKNSIIYTPTVKNINRKIANVNVYDAGANQVDTEHDSQSSLFTATVLAGKIYLTPIIGADIESGKTYKVQLNVIFEGGESKLSSVLSVKTAQSVPAVKYSPSTVDLHLSRKNDAVSFIISPKTTGYAIESVSFGEKDTKANSTFNMIYEPQEDGSIKVTLSLKDSIAYSCDEVNDIEMYVKYVGQGTNTNGLKTVVKVKINK